MGAEVGEKRGAPVDKDTTGCLGDFPKSFRRFIRRRLRWLKRKMEPQAVADNRTEDKLGKEDLKSTEAEALEGIRASTPGTQKLKEYLSSRKQKVLIEGKAVSRFLPKRMRNRKELERVAQELRVANLTAGKSEKRNGGEAWEVKEETDRSRPRSRQILPARLLPLNYDEEKQKLIAEKMENKARLAADRRERLKNDMKVKLSQQFMKVQQVNAARQKSEIAFQEEQAKKLKYKETHVKQRRLTLQEQMKSQKEKEKECSKTRQQKAAELDVERANSRALTQQEKQEKVQKRKQVMMEKKHQKQTKHLDRVRRLKRIKQLEKELIRLKNLPDEAFKRKEEPAANLSDNDYCGRVEGPEFSPSLTEWP